MVLCHSMNAGSVVGTLQVLGTLKPYHMQKNLFELFALTGSEDANTLGKSTHTINRIIARARKQRATW